MSTINFNKDPEKSTEAAFEILKSSNFISFEKLEVGRKEIFEIQGEIGEGGFGKVFKAKHKLDAKVYALKVVHTHLSLRDDVCSHPGFKEIQAISQLNHKNIVRYYSCWVEPVEPDGNRIQKIVNFIKKKKTKDDPFARANDPIKENSDSDEVADLRLSFRHHNRVLRKRDSSNENSDF